MAKAGLAALVVAIATGTGAATAQAEPRLQPALVITVENHADLSRHALEDGLAMARHLYLIAGVRTEWPVTKRPGTAALPRPDSSWITVVLLGRGMSSLGTKASVLGAAPRMPADARCHVYIFADRIERFAKRNDVPLARVLGHVIAHEIGHVLLPGAGHAKAGVMQAVTRAKAMSPGAFPSLFTTAENHAIRDFISRRLNARHTEADVP